MMPLNYKLVGMETGLYFLIVLSKDAVRYRKELRHLNFILAKYLQLKPPQTTTNRKLRIFTYQDLNQILDFGLPPSYYCLSTLPFFISPFFSMIRATLISFPISMPSYLSTFQISLDKKRTFM